MFFSHESAGTVCQQQDNGDDAHQQDDAQIEPEGLDMPAAQDLLTTIERGATQFVVWRQIDNTAAGHQMIADDIHHTELVGTGHELLQLDVVVVLLQLQEGILALRLDRR